jgi:hypothetical protein
LRQVRTTILVRWIRNTAHPTEIWGVDVEKDEVIDYNHKGCHAQKRIDLQKAKISPQTAQKPEILERGNYHYRPRSSTGSGDVLG